METFLSLETPMKKAVFLAVYSFTNNGTGECFASQRAIAKRTGCSLQTVQRIIPMLLGKYLKVTGSQSVRGGIVTKYCVSDCPAVTKKLKVTDGGNQATDGEVHKQLKETSTSSNGELFKQAILAQSDYLQRKHKEHSLLDVDSELSDAVDWVEESGRQIKRPRQFFTNWLKKASEFRKQKGGQDGDWRDTIPTA